MRVDEAKTRASASRPDPYLGRTLGGYRIEEIVGRGGMGVVYRATQLSLNRPVAIKVLGEALAADPQLLDRFHREVDILSRLSHPNVVTVLERGEVDGRPWLAMEYVRGTSLRDVLRKGPLPAAEALPIVRAILAALEHAHGHGIVHRDIKPENVLIAPGGVVKVADFGLGRLLAGGETTRLTHTHLMLGTYEYMAPEQREKAKEADERSDLYATGVVLYEALAGELPIGHFQPLSRKRPRECDSRIDEIVERSLDKSPERRYQRASEMGAAVSRLLTAAPGAVPAPPPGTPAARCRTRGRPPRGRGLVLVAALVGAFFLLRGSGGNELGLTVASIETELPEGLLARVFGDPAVRAYVTRHSGTGFEGASCAVEDWDVRLRVAGDDEIAAAHFAAAFAHALERNAGGRLTRTIRGTPAFERRLAANPPPLLNEEPAPEVDR